MGTVRDVKMVGGELVIESGDLVPVRDGEAIAQDIEQALQLFKGEWFLDVNAGVPYFDEVFVKNPKTSALRALFRRVIAERPGVLDVLALDLSYDGPTRELTVTWTVNTDAGELSGSTEMA